MRFSRLIFVVGCILSVGFVVINENFITDLPIKMQEFAREKPQVKIHLFFNQEKYAPGDTAFYKVYFATENLKAVPARQVVNVYLANADGVILKREIIGIKDGNGFNQFAIPSNLSAGNYKLIVFSDWMRNFDNSLFYSKDLIVTDGMRVTKTENYEPKIYFEGGHLVEGVTNRGVVDFSTIKTDSPLLIKDQQENIVASFTNSKLGFAGFSIVPESEKKYSLWYSQNGKSSNVAFPLVEDGISIHVSENKIMRARDVELTISERSLLKRKSLYLVVTGHSNLLFTSPVKFQENSFTISIPNGRLIEGVNRINIFSEQGEEILERMFFNRPENVHVEIKSNQPIYHNREKVTLDIGLTDDLGNALRGEFAIRITNRNYLPNHHSSSIKENLLLTSDLGYDQGINRNYFGDSVSITAIDRYLITRKWRRFSWDDVMEPASDVPKHPFRKMIYLNGEVVNNETGKRVPDSSRVVIYLQKHLMGYEVFTGKNGNINLPFLFDFWGDDQLFYYVDRNEKELPNSRINLSYDSIAFASSAATLLDSLDAYASYKQKRDLMDRSYAYFNQQKTDSNIGTINPNADFEDEFIEVDMTVNVQKYIVFPTMEDLIREVLPTLQHRKSGGKPTVRTYLLNPSMTPLGDPLYIIDGIMTKSTAYFMSLLPADIFTVKIIRDQQKLRRLGAIATNGIVLVHTKKTSHPILIKDNTMIPVLGLTKPVPFKNIDYSIPSNLRIPDFRSTLYWNPSVRTDAFGHAAITCYASDDVGDFDIQVEGITNAGKIFSGKGQFRIEFMQSKK